MYSIARIALVFSMFLLAGCGGGGGGDAPPPARNSSPTARILASSNAAYSSQSVALDGAESTDTDGSIASFQWTQIAGPTVTINDPQSASASFSVPALSSAATIEIRLTVTDNEGGAGTATVSVSVGPAPLATTIAIADNSPFTVDDESVVLQIDGVDLDGNPVTPVSMSWSSDLQGSLGAASLGVPLEVVLQAGSHELTLTIDAGDLGTIATDSTLHVLPRMVEPTEFHRTPAAGAQKLIPVIIVSYVPTADGVTLDTSIAAYSYRPPGWGGDTVASVLDYIRGITERKKFAMEERTKFRGYKNAAAQPYLGYQVLAHYMFYEPVPLSGALSPFAPNFPLADFHTVMSQADAEAWVNTRGVKEFWVTNYFSENATFEFWESNMSSPILSVGDVSNSNRDNSDLPIFDSTYAVFGINYFRTQAEAIHNVGHHIEALFSHIDWLYDGGSAAVFWSGFVGASTNAFAQPVQYETGRCGWTHMPPNTVVHYDYENAALAETDCEDWRPDGAGAKVMVNNAYFNGLDYDWPANFGPSTLPQRAESNFYIWWMQNMPGEANGIPHGLGAMSNWWEFVADWDAAVIDGTRLYVSN